MPPTPPPRCFHALLLMLALALSSCGGGSDSDSGGGGGSDNGGTATVAGNVSWVVEPAPQARDRTPGQILLAAAVDYLAAPANAQAVLDGIQVIGGGQQDTTDAEGNFSLEGVTSSDNFILRFELGEDQSITLPIGVVPDGSRVTVINIVLNADQGFAQAEDIEIEENAGDPSPENGGGDENGTAM